MEYIEKVFGYYQKALIGIDKCNCGNSDCNQCRFINMTFHEFLDFRYGLDQDKLPDSNSEEKFKRNDS